MSEIGAAADLNSFQKGKLPDHLGRRWAEVGPGVARGYFELAPHHMGQTGFCTQSRSSPSPIRRAATAAPAPGPRRRRGSRRSN